MNRHSWARRKKRSSANWISKATRFAIYYRDRFDCVYCRLVFPPAVDGVGLTLDHIVLRSKGGSNKPKNLVTACLECNSARQDAELNPKELKRLERQALKPLNHELGRGVERIIRSVRAHDLIHPLTLRVSYSLPVSTQLSLICSSDE